MHSITRSREVWVSEVSPNQTHMCVLLHVCVIPEYLPLGPVYDMPGSIFY